MPHGETHPITVQARERVSYQLDVDGPIEKVLAEETNSPNNFAEEDDAIIATDTGYRVEGQTGSTDPGNSTWWGDVFHVSGPVTGIHITSSPVPETRFYIDGVQQSAAEIAARWKPENWNVLELVGEGPTFSYDFTAQGTARRYQTALDVAAEAKTDSVSQQGSQTVVSGGAGGTGGDAYLVEGDVTQFSGSGQFGLRWNGSPVTVGELLGDADGEPGNGENGENGDGENGNGNGENGENGNGGQPDADDGFDWSIAAALLAGVAAVSRRSGK